MYNMAKDNKAVGKMAVFVASNTNKIYALVYLIGMVYEFFQNSNLLFRFILITFITSSKEQAGHGSPFISFIY